MIVYDYIGAGETFDRIPARRLTEAEWERHTTGRSKDELALIGRLYKRTRAATPKPAPDNESTTTRADGALTADQAEEATDGNTNGV
jgi:hypothetical protein